MVDALKKKIRILLDHVPAGALPAPTLFSDPRTIPGSDSDGAAAAGGGPPRWTYGSFYPDEDADGGAAAAGGGPPVARTKTSNGPPLYRGLPALAPSASEYGPCTGSRSGYQSDVFPAMTHRDAEGNLHVSLCPSPNCSSGLAVEAVADGLARWAPRKATEDDE